MNSDGIENLRSQIILAVMKLAIKRPKIKFIEDTDGRGGKLILVPHQKDPGPIGYGAYNRRALLRTLRWLWQRNAEQQDPGGQVVHLMMISTFSL